MQINENILIEQGDCLKLMNGLKEKSIDFILCDLPYGTTACKWDIVVPFRPLWEQYKRIIKNNGAICLFGNEPFGSLLRTSNIEQYKYDWYWIKDGSKATNFVHAKNMPLKNIETISVFSGGAVAHIGNIRRMPYNPQGITPFGKTVKGNHKGGENNEHKMERKSHKEKYVREFTNYPNQTLMFKTDWKVQLHPTQKPVALLQYLIETYSNKGQVVLDNCAGSFSTGVACINTHRKFIGFELDEKYFEIGKERLLTAIA